MPAIKKVYENIEVRKVNKPLFLKDSKKGVSVKKMVKKLLGFRKMKMRKNKVKKIFVVFFSALYLLLSNPYSAALALEIPTPPSAPPSAPEAPAAPTPPPPPASETTEPTPPPAPTVEESLNLTPTPDAGDILSSEEDEEEEGISSEGATPQDVSDAPSVNENDTGGQDNGGNVGDTTIDTGDANNSGTILTSGNTNSTTSETGSGSGATIVNTDNESDSNNSGSVSVNDTDNTTQYNSATVNNDLTLGSTTGDNESSGNVGNTTITTGDANTAGTIINAVNTNIDGVMVNEFNIVDDHVGDVILDFSTGCISGCGSGDTAVVNSGNGSNSTNTGEVDTTNTENTFQTNEATLINDMILFSDTGNNDADENTGGNSTITTGDANVSANILNFANNNIAGDVVYAVVNIFGNLVGDIILPDGSVLSCCASDVNVANTGNGVDSTNTGTVTQNTTDNIYQFNTADIDNNLLLDANTGDNSTSDNTGGANSITTGDTDVLAQVVNVANMNLVGGNWWLVIVNEAGQWIGKIIGAPDDANMAGSSGIEFIIDENGEIVVTNSGNGDGSSNTGTVNSDNTSNIVQTNNANITNNVQLYANTGDNSASENTGGSSSITTGDANIVANIVNFVNNNIVGSGKLFVTVVNVFGSWIGDFVGPGQSQESNQESQALGGAAQENASSNSNDSNGSSNSSNTGTSRTSTVAGVVASIAKQISTRGGGSVTVGSANGEEDLIAEAPLAMGTKVDKKKITVNLAWLTLLIPSVGVYYFLKKRRANAATLPAKGA